MQRTIKNILVFTLLYLLTSCSKDFLNENLTPVNLPVGFSSIYISPDWQSSNYLFKLSSVKDIDYNVVSKPSWLNIGSKSGHLTDSLAVIQCSATKNPDFKEVGIYMDFMSVMAEEKEFKVPVAYITEGNPTIQVQNSQALPFNIYGNPSLQIENTGLGILIWNISSMPDWLVLDTAHLESNGIYLLPNTSYNIPLLFNFKNAYTGRQTGTIVLSTNDQEHSSVTINVTANLGTPQLNLYTSSINFSYAETSKTFSFYNIGNGSLVWEFKDIPEWLTITPSSGVINPSSSSNNIILSCDQTKLMPGQNSALLTLKTNDSSHPTNSILVSAITPGITENTYAVVGNIIDAEFNKYTNILYYVTSLPNKLIAYDVTGKKVLNELSLSKAPTSLAISEDWTKAAVGHNGFLSAINLTSKTVTATYSLDYSVNDIAWAENNWFCYTQKGGSFSGLHWINTADGSLYDSTEKYDLDGSSIIKKVPNQAYLIATRNSTSPSGFYAYDVAKKSKISYSHMNLSNFWFSENGEYIFSTYLNVFRTSSSTGSTNTYDADINSIGKINIETGSNYGLQYLYHSAPYLWVLQKESYTSDASTSLYQVEDNDYTIVKKMVYSFLYQPDANTTPYSLSANYVFANKEGTEIAVLCKGVSNNSWVIQFIPVK